MTADDHTRIRNRIDHRADFATLGVFGTFNNVERLVEDHELAFIELERIQVRMHVDPHGPTVHQDLARSVLIRTEEHAVGVRRGAELVDLFFQEFDLLLRLLQHPHELFVLPFGITMLRARLVVSSSQRFEVREHPVEPVSELIRVTAKEVHGVLESFSFTVRTAHTRSSGIAPMSTGGTARETCLQLVVLGASARGAGLRWINPSHDVSHEALPALRSRIRIMFAHCAVSSLPIA
jgi:hypothetical protein